jgi:hypothetical protein
MNEQSARRERGLSLGELVDLELQLREDRGADPAALRRRDELIGREICANGVPASRAYVLHRWLEALHPEPASTPGRKLAAAYRLASFLLIVVALVSGASAAATLLSYHGGDPVNVISYLAVLVGLQLVLAVLAATAMLPIRARRRLSPLGLLHTSLRELGLRRAGFDAALGRSGGFGLSDGSGDTRVVSGALRAWGAVYGESERWRLLAITQRAAVAFNVGALAASFYTVAVSALAFSWSTTLDIDAVAVHRATSIVSLPWFWISDAVPSLELVEASRYFPGGSYDPALLGDWWPFLLACLVGYGLIPRTLLWVFAEWRGRALQASLPLDHGDVRLAYSRLTAGWAADADSGSSTGPPAGAAAPSVAAGAIGGSCRVILWADAALDSTQAEALVKRRTGCSSAAVDAAADANADSDSAIVIVAEAWEPPTRALGRRVAELRAGIDTRTPIVVLLIGSEAGDSSRGADEADAAVWRRHLAGLGDPYLYVDDGRVTA